MFTLLFLSGMMLYMQTIPPVMPGDVADIYTIEFEATGNDCFRMTCFIRDLHDGTISIIHWDVETSTETILDTFEAPADPAVDLLISSPIQFKSIQYSSHPVTC